MPKPHNNGTRSMGIDDCNGEGGGGEIKSRPPKNVSIWESFLQIFLHEGALFTMWGAFCVFVRGHFWACTPLRKFLRTPMSMGTLLVTFAYVTCILSILGG